MTERRLGPFLISQRIGGGGMGQTYVAERSGPAGFTQRVCLKRIITSDAEDARWIRMFQMEARLVARLHHPSIVSLIDFGEDQGDWWMALELVEGPDLKAILTGLHERGERMPVDCALYITAEVAKALHHAHARRFDDGTSAGLVHRDVSPSNIMVGMEGSVQLTDFGIAKVLHAERTRTGDIKGKSGYMSPEQAMGEEVDARTDLFALGVVLYEMLAGARPFDGKTYIATQLNVATGKRADLRTMAPEVPGRVVEIVDALLKTEKNERPGTAAEVLDLISEMPVRANVVRTLGWIAGRTHG